MSVEYDALDRALFPMIRSLAQKYSNPPYIEIEDLLQEGRIGLYRAHQIYKQGVGEFQPFARMIVQQHMIEYCRKFQRVKERAYMTKVSLYEPIFADSEVLLEETIGQNDPAFDSIEIQPLEEFIYRGLSKDQAESLRLLVAGNRVSDIAQILKISLRSAAGRIEKARIRLRKLRPEIYKHIFTEATLSQ